MTVKYIATVHEFAGFVSQTCDGFLSTVGPQISNSLRVYRLQLYPVSVTLSLGTSSVKPT
jgi:hypothetical protein